jgi:hypothetical protein
LKRLNVKQIRVGEAQIAVEDLFRLDSAQTIDQLRVGYVGERPNL